MVINISSHGAESYLLSVPYGVGKAAIDKVTQRHRVRAAAARRRRRVAVARARAHRGPARQHRRRPTTGARELHGLDISFGESPKFNGRAVVALAADPDILERSGGSFWSASLAREYGFTEDDGHLPPEMANSILTIMGDDMPDYWRGVERAAPSERPEPWATARTSRPSRGQGLDPDPLFDELRTTRAGRARADAVRQAVLGADPLRGRAVDARRSAVQSRGDHRHRRRSHVGVLPDRGLDPRHGRPRAHAHPPARERDVHRPSDAGAARARAGGRRRPARRDGADGAARSTSCRRSRCRCRSR